MVDGLEVLCALARLSEDEREAVVDRYVVGRSVAEIAETMGCSRAAAGMIVTRGRRRLAALLGVPEEEAA